jgi:signal peptidase I
MKLSSPVLDEAHAVKCELAVGVLLSSGTLRLQVTGWSMLPTVWPGDTLVIECASRSAVSAGDIVLFGRDRRLFAHRVIEKSPFADVGLVTRGDAMPSADAPVSSGELLGKVSFILRNGTRIEPRRSLRLPQRAVAALVRSSEMAARVVVGAHSMHEALIHRIAGVKHARSREVSCQN